jgi:hypothetical protein
VLLPSINLADALFQPHLHVFGTRLMAALSLRELTALRHASVADARRRLLPDSAREQGRPHSAVAPADVYGTPNGLDEATSQDDGDLRDLEFELTIAQAALKSRGEELAATREELAKVKSFLATAERLAQELRAERDRWAAQAEVLAPRQASQVDFLGVIQALAMR